MRTRPRLAAVAALFAISSVHAVLAAQPQQRPTAATIKSTARLVLVDVVVTDAQGKPVSGLQRDDFTVLEDGVPQPLRSFEEHRAGAAPAARPEAPAPPASNVFTNAPTAQIDGPLTIVLLDTLNTEMTDQGEARRHMLGFLRSMPKGQRIAVFTLGSRVRMLQGFTDDIDPLIAAVDKLLPGPSPVLVTQGHKDQDEELLLDVPAAMAVRLRQFLQESYATLTDSRVASTLAALREIAQSMASVAGRKNLLWLSATFPWQIDAVDDRLIDPGAVRRHYDREATETAARLSASHISIYPIDVRGLLPIGLEAHVSGPLAIAAGGYLVGQRSEGVRDAISTMSEFAQQTGGKAFYNNNDLKTALADAMQLGSSYYALAYVPANRRVDGKFRRIEVRTARKVAHLAYRNGYFATDDGVLRAEKDRPRDMQRAMSRETLPPTELLLSATVTPVQKGKIAVRYFLDGGQIGVRDNDGHLRDLAIDFVTVGWDGHGKQTAYASQTALVPATSDALANIERAGFIETLQVDAKPGTSQLRVAVLDRRTGRIGAVDVPIAQLPTPAAN